jgi:hypothetical protein
VTAQWVLLTESGEHAVLAEMKRNHRLTIEDLAHTIEEFSELLDDDAQGLKSEGPARRFRLMCDRFSPDRIVYSLFRRMSDSVHPSLRTFVHHLETDDQRGVYGLTLDSPADPDPDLLLALSISAMLALSAVEHLRRDRLRMDDVERIAQKWRVPVDLRGDDTRVELQRPQK